MGGNTCEVETASAMIGNDYDVAVSEDDDVQDTMGFDTLRDAAGVTVPADEPEPIYVVTGPYGQDAQLRSLGERVQLKGTYRMRVKDLRLVDDIDPPYEEAQREKVLELKLYLVAPRGGNFSGARSAPE